MFYYFDQAENDKKIIELQKCTKCIGDCFCATLDLDTNHTLHFGFFNGNNYELNNNTAFKLEIAPDPIANIMQRYGFEHNNNLPTYEEKNDKMFALQNIFATIKNFFKKIFNKNVPV